MCAADKVRNSRTEKTGRDTGGPEWTAILHTPSPDTCTACSEVRMMGKIPENCSDPEQSHTLKNRAEVKHKDKHTYTHGDTHIHMLTVGHLALIESRVSF